MDTAGTKETEMSWINNYTYQASTDQQECDIARLAESNWQVRQALSGRVSWWRRLLCRPPRAAQQHCDPASGTASNGDPRARVAH